MLASRKSVQNGFPRSIAQRGKKMPTEREKTRMFNIAADRSPKLGVGHAAHQERQREHRHHCEHPVKRPERPGEHLAQHHVVPAQVGQEKQPKRAFGFFTRQRVGGRPQAGQQAVAETGPAHDGKENIALHSAPPPNWLRVASSSHNPPKTTATMATIIATTTNRGHARQPTVRVGRWAD